MATASNRRHAGRSRLRGIALIEALVAVLIFAFGVIGLVGLQVAMTRAQGTAKYRADAAYLGSQVLGQMWADRTKLDSFNTGGADACAGYAPCKDWSGKVASSLPQGKAAIAASQATGVVTMTITWSLSAEGTHTHVLTTSIR
ncbi:MAG: pilus assembly protein PilV [Ramlibacter sp.]|jgi:type IV pilus assembly protein PilV|uniref:type IV pilus modification PilV family protein n=1 Tax=Ramlibacter sp. TaxID=1917967 RepID=UPI00261A5ACD|nr:pilus assembly protein PilV [Ramlibacter sp.]MDB5753335.1 pilus assembly protein PilV [Ramlibacter sp.]